MHVSIEAQPRGGLRLIHELDLFRLGRLEGYNGIGKSAAIRLLRVCVGDQPYLPQEQSLWSSFRQYLGACVVTMSGLSDGSTLQWHLDPDLWPEDSSERLGEIGRITLNGADVTLARVRELVTVDRIVGNEGLVPTLVRQLQPRRAAMQAAFGEGSKFETRLFDVEELLRAVATQLHRIVDVDLSQMQAATHQTAARKQEIATQVALVRTRAEDLAAAQDLTRKLADVRTRSGDLELRAQQLADQMAATDLRLKELDRQVAQAGERHGAEPAAVRELGLAQRNAGRAESKLQEVLLTCRAAARALDLDGDPQAINVPALAGDVQAQLEAGAQRLHSVFSAPRLAEVADRLVMVLDEAQRAGLGEEVIDAGGPDRVEITLSELRRRLARNAAQLKQAEPPAEAARLQAEQNDLARRLRLLSSLEGVQAEVSRRIGLAEKATERLTEASRAVSALSGQQFGELVAEREQLTERLRALAVERAEVVRAREALGGGLPESELARLLKERLEAGGASVETLASEAQKALATAALVEQQAATAAAVASDAARSEKEAQAAVTEALAHLRGDDGFAWLRDALPELNYRPATLPEAQELFRNILGGVQRAQHRADQARSAPAQLSAVVGALEQQLSNPSISRSPTETDRPYLIAAREWFGEVVSGWFRQPQILNTLFVGASTVRVDLSDMTVNWDVDSEQFTRPLTAFSSGEQAFAYTRAQLEILDAEASTADQIVALDEFGAFISRNWLYRLESYLGERAKSHASDRLLLILPLTRTEEELGQSATDAEKLSQTESDGYFVTRLFDEE